MAALLEYSDQFRGPIWTVMVRMLVILAVAWIAGRALAKKSDRIFPNAGNSAIIFSALLALIVLFSVGMLRHLTFHSKAYDLAIFDQVIWNLAHGNGWECSVRGVHDLRGDHFEPILLLFVPIYKILPHVGWLLLAQAASLVGAATILWATYRNRIGESAAFMLFLAFMFYPPIHWLSIADFHPIALAPFFIMVAWWGRERDRWWAFVIGLLGLGACGEEGFIVAGWWGLWEFAMRTRSKGQAIRWIGLASMLFFWAGFIYLSVVYIPAHRMEGAGYFYVHRYAYLGNSISEIATNFFTKPGLWIGHLLDGRSLALLALYLVPLGLIPLMKPKILLLLLPTLLYTLLSDSVEQKSIFHQYTAMWIPFLMIASAAAMEKIQKGTGADFDKNKYRQGTGADFDKNKYRQGTGADFDKNKYRQGTGADFDKNKYRQGTGADFDKNQNRAPVPLLSVSLLFASLLAFLAFSPIFGMSMHPEILTPESWAGEAAGIVSNVGPDEPVSAPSALCPHLSHRRVLLLKPADQWPGAEHIIMLPDFPPSP